MVQLSAEVRWFWKRLLPAKLESWFHGCGVFPPGGGPPPREDEYLIDAGQSEIGLKKRGNKPGIEVKGLVKIVPRSVQIGPHTQPVQIWAKWTTNTLRLDGLPTVVAKKTRWLRKYDCGESQVREIELDSNELPKKDSLPAEGCNVELTSVSFGNVIEWWTFACEAFGSLESVESNLRRATSDLVTMNIPVLSGGIELSYPAWLTAFGDQLHGASVRT